MGSIWRFKRRRTKWVWVWVWRWWLNLLKINCKNVVNLNYVFFQNKNGPKRDMRIFAPVPKTQNHFSWKQETHQKGTCSFLHQSLKRRNIFHGNKNPRFGDCFRGPLCDFCPFLQYGAILAFFILTYLRPYMLSRKCLQKSSANYLVPRVFAQKGFAISIFGHFFCPFPENFIESCRVKTKNNNFKLQDLL